MPDSSGESNFVSEESDNGLESASDGEPETDNFVLVRFPTKNTLKFYVGKVISVHEDTVKVNFLRRKGMQSNFCFPLVPDINEVDLKDAKKLPMPTSKGTVRTSGIFSFNYKFDSCVF